MSCRGVVWASVLLLGACAGGEGGDTGGAGAGNGEPSQEQSAPGDAPGTTAVVAFVDATAEAGLSVTGEFDETEFPEAYAVGSGACAGDFDGDGWLDLYLVGGPNGRNRLFRNRCDGTFEDVAPAAGVDLVARGRCGPTFVDFDGDGRLDLFIGGVERPPVLFRNRGDGTFEDVTAAAGLNVTRNNNISAAFGDYDKDGDLDLYIAHWADIVFEVEFFLKEQLWRNNDGVFEDVSTEAGIAATYESIPEFAFTPNFADINNDGWPDLLVAADYGTSQFFLNRKDGTFRNTTTDVISDKFGMGASVGDYDNDGDIDWFVTSIFTASEVPNRGGGPEEDVVLAPGNRMYRNLGNGSFEDATTEAGVRNGHFGWGASFADFDNDGWMDLFHVNGWVDEVGIFADVGDPSVLFMAQGDGTFQEKAQELGIDDKAQGRGVVCFDFDRDGDLDIFVSNLNQPGRLFRNDTETESHFLTVILKAPAPNTHAVGAKVSVTTGATTQMRELQCGNNFVSANPIEAHFGLGTAARVDQLRIDWPDGQITILTGVPADQVLTLRHPFLP